MDLERFYVSFKSSVAETNSELQSYVIQFCASQGYCVGDVRIFFDDTEIMPGIQVALKPRLQYDTYALKELETSLEQDLNNVIFDYIYNKRHKINAEELEKAKSVPHIHKLLPQLLIASQN